MIAALALLFMSAGPPACAPIEKEDITGADLAAVLPQFGSLPSAQFIGHAPAPGRQRVIGVPELKVIAERAGLPFAPSEEVCFAWPTSPLDAEAALKAMQSAYPEGSIQLLETSRFPAPNGVINFPRTGLQRLPAQVMLWRGYVSYGTDRRFDVWARVKVTVRQDRVTATELLRAGQIIRGDQVRAVHYEGPPTQEAFASSAEEVIGKIAMTTLLAGSPVKASSVTSAPEVSRGDVVTVVVVNGAARITLDAVADTSARTGETVQLRNQETGKSFQAKVSGSGEAILLLGRMK